MDSKTFDRLIAEAAQPSRRSTLRLLAAGLLGGVLAGRWVAPAAAQFADDRDSDGLIDADETAIYGTNPGAYDSDGDGLNDGEEIYYGTNPLVADANTIQVDSDGDGLQDADENTIYGTQRLDYDTDGDGVGDGEEVYLGTNPLVAPPANGGAVGIGDINSGGNADGAIGVGDTGSSCRGLGASCDYDGQCCGPNVLCCFDGTTLTTRCEDVTVYGGHCL